MNCFGLTWRRIQRRWHRENGPTILHHCGQSGFIFRFRQAALKALEIDERLAEAHSVMGVVLKRNFNWKEAESEFCRALELDPKSVLAGVGLRRLMQVALVPSMK